jgi:hypothetical protein
MGTLKLVFWLFLIGALVYVGALTIPPYFANYQFEDAIKSEATLSTYTTKSEDEIRQSVFKKAQELEIPITQEKIKVHRAGTQGSGSLLIEAHYTVHVELPGFPLDLNFDPATKNKGVM